MKVKEVETDIIKTLKRNRVVFLATPQLHHYYARNTDVIFQCLKHLGGTVQKYKSTPQRAYGGQTYKYLTQLLNLLKLLSPRSNPCTYSFHSTMGPKNIQGFCPKTQASTPISTPTWERHPSARTTPRRPTHQFISRDPRTRKCKTVLQHILQRRI